MATVEQFTREMEREAKLDAAYRESVLTEWIQDLFLRLANIFRPSRSAETVVEPKEEVSCGLASAQQALRGNQHPILFDLVPLYEFSTGGETLAGVEQLAERGPLNLPSCAAEPD